MTVFELLTRNNKLTVIDGKVAIEPIEGGFTTYPIQNLDTAMKVTPDEYIGLITGVYRIENKEIIEVLQENNNFSE